jgi:hypothetical protein
MSQMLALFLLILTPNTELRTQVSLETIFLKTNIENPMKQMYWVVIALETTVAPAEATGSIYHDAVQFESSEIGVLSEHLFLQ